MMDHTSSFMPNMMIFHQPTSSNTPQDSLFSPFWTPTTTGQYAGTCIFLIVLAIIARGLHAFSCTLERRRTVRNQQRRIIVAGRLQGLTREVPPSPTIAERAGKEGEKAEELLVVPQRVRPWRWSEDLPRAGMLFVSAGVAYLLMFAVMTGNVGYFMSVLGGLFLGELGLGRYAHV